MHFDPIKAEVMARYLIAASEEMAATLMRTAFSPNIKERADCSTAIFDVQGQVVALAQRVPIHLGSMVGAIDAILKRYPLDQIKPGDMFVANDPYNGGGTHLPDINVIAPVFYKKNIVAFVANIAHHADVGGMVPGSQASVCKSIFQEGLRIPPVRIMREGKLNSDVVDVILLNSRTPDERSGDLKAQFAANTVGIRSVLRLFERYGARETAQTIAAYLDFTERRFRAAISQLPRGQYSAEDYLDGNIEGETCRIKLTLTIHRNRLDFDFTGSDLQLDSARNIPYRALLATVYTVAKCLLDPDVPANAGYYRTLNIIAPEGCVVNAVAPAAIGCRANSSTVLGDVIADTLSQAMPHKALAASGPHHVYVLAGINPRTGKYFVDYESLAGGMGARSNRNGIDGVRVHASGSSNLPVEALEHAYPLRVVRYALRDGSAGEGQFRGGMGVIRDYQVLADDIVVSLSSERQHVPARGMAGGGAGACGVFILNPGTPEERVLPSASGEVALPRGSILRIATPGGGGYGRSLTPSPSATTAHARIHRTRNTVPD
jgi:N-methylhydantoinase B